MDFFNLQHLRRTSVTLTWAPPESVEGSPITRCAFYLLVQMYTCVLSLELTFPVFPPSSLFASNSQSFLFHVLFLAFVLSSKFFLLHRFTVQQKTKDTESRTIGHTGGDLLTYRVDGLLPRYPSSLNNQTSILKCIDDGNIQIHL